MMTDDAQKSQPPAVLKASATLGALANRAATFLQTLLEGNLLLILLLILSDLNLFTGPMNTSYFFKS